MSPQMRPYPDLDQRTPEEISFALTADLDAGLMTLLEAVNYSISKLHGDIRFKHPHHLEDLRCMLLERLMDVRSGGLIETIKEAEARTLASLNAAVERVQQVEPAE